MDDQDRILEVAVDSSVTRLATIVESNSNIATIRLWNLISGFMIWQHVLDADSSMEKASASFAESKIVVLMNDFVSCLSSKNGGVLWKYLVDPDTKLDSVAYIHGGGSVLVTGVNKVSINLPHF